MTGPLVPGDQRDETLAGYVHPRGWARPRPAGRYDLIAVGGGTAGLVAAAGAAEIGARVALVERAWLGGDCLVTGCVPSKALLKAASVARQAQRAAEFGVRVGEPEVDFAAAMERMRSVRARIGEHDGARAFSERGVDVYLGDAVFTGRRQLEVDGLRLPFKRALIATGARPRALPLPGADEVEVLTSDTIWGLTRRPQSLVVVGGGPLGCELGQAFARLQTPVTLVQRAERLLPEDDPEASALVQRSLEADGVEVLLGAKVRRLEERGERIAVHLEGGEEPLLTDKVLAAVGRQPNIAGLGLDAAGVATGERGVLVDRHQRTTNRRVFAAGDVCGLQPFTHVAHAQAEVALKNALSPLRPRFKPGLVPHVTYTDPELAHIGRPFAELEAIGRRREVITLPLSAVDRCVVEGEDEGFARVHLVRGSDRILGATFVGPSAGEQIAPLAVALASGGRLAPLRDTVFPYPTRAELARKLADEAMIRGLSSAARRAARQWIRALR